MNDLRTVEKDKWNCEVKMTMLKVIRIGLLSRSVKAQETAKEILKDYELFCKRNKC